MSRVRLDQGRWVSVAISSRLRKEAWDSDLFWLTDELIERLRQLFSMNLGKPWVDAGGC